MQVVFRGGEGALQCLPPLIDVIPEARLNLVIYYLKQGKDLILHVKKRNKICLKRTKNKFGL